MRHGLITTLIGGLAAIAAIILLSVLSGCTSWQHTKTTIKYEDGRVIEQEISRTDGRLLSDE